MATEMSELPFSTHFVLVHGASLGGWCWYKIKCLLESIGQKVSCPDLASSGIDPVNADTIRTFEEYNKPLHDIFTSLPAGEKVVLLGHNAGGLSLTEVIQKFPEKIQVAVFVGAAMLRNGFQTEQDINNGLPDLSRFGDVNDYGYGEGRDNPPTSAILKEEVRREILYQMSPLEACTLATLVMKPYPTREIHRAIFPDDEDSDKVPRVYIKTMHDNTLTQDQQDAMIKRWPPSDVYTIDSDHCAMFSNPSRLFGILVEIASKFSRDGSGADFGGFNPASAAVGAGMDMTLVDGGWILISKLKKNLGNR